MTDRHDIDGIPGGLGGGDGLGGAGGGAGAGAPPWWVFHDSGREPSGEHAAPPIPAPPPWRVFEDTGAPLPPPARAPEGRRRMGRPEGGTLDRSVVEMVNVALHVRRPLLVTGRPGTGKSSLAYRIAAELGLGPVLSWPIVSRTTLKDGLYDYDAIGRVQDTPPPVGGAAEDRVLPDLGRYLTLGPLGTALLPWTRPRVLLVDELDKSDIDLPNDLLHVFEEGEFRIRELERHRQRPVVKVMTADHTDTVPVANGHVRCHEFPVVVITSNGEREFPPAFRRRCLEIRMPDPDEARLTAMVTAHFGGERGRETRELIREFLDHSREHGGLATDQLLNTVHMLSNGAAKSDETSWARLRDALWHALGTEPPT
ncbi:AAA family ATPase [Streptomyces sp. NPDC021098]|uniref:AAA family ATPase n=1 Tax=unclassified Streptomyces TaxID=2593676 RepID=UPI00379C95F4